MKVSDTSFVKVFVEVTGCDELGVAESDPRSFDKERDMESSSERLTVGLTEEVSGDSVTRKVWESDADVRSVHESTLADREKVAVGVGVPFVSVRRNESVVLAVRVPL